MSSQTIEQAIAAARAAAGNIAQDTNANMGGSALVQHHTGGTAVGAPLAKGPPLAFDDLNQGALNVAGWLKLSKFGMQIGADPTLFDEFKVIVDLSEVAYSYSVRFGNPVQYRKSYDRITDARGGSWMQTLVEAQKIDPKASEFRSADIPFYPLEPIVSKTGKVLIEQGEAMGHSLTVTAWKPFATFVSNIKKKHNVNIGSDKIQFTLKSQARKNDKGEWGEFIWGDDVVVVDDFPWNDPTIN